MSLQGSRFLVNSGISEYRADSKRYLQRSTRAHNTMELNGSNSSEVWSAFRVGRRAHVSSINIERWKEKVKISAKHDGYSRFLNPVFHTRELSISSQNIEVIDSVSGRFSRSRVYWRFHPDVQLEDVDQKYVIAKSLSGAVVKITVSNADVKVKTGWWYPDFGVRSRTKILILRASSNSIKTQFSLVEL